MKRTLIWIGVLLAPTLLWLAFTDNGRASWRLLPFQGAGALGSSAAEAERSTGSDVPIPGQIVLVPAQPRPTHPSLRVQLSGNGSLGLMVIDPQGRRSGIDAHKRTTAQEIPDSKVERVPNGDSAEKEHGPIVVSIDPARATAYAFEITGAKPGEFQLAVGGVSPALHAITQILNGSVPSDTSVHYRIDLTKIRPLPLTGGRAMTATVVDPEEAFISGPEERVIPPSDPALVAAATAITKDPCGYFLKALRAVPHEKLIRTDGAMQSLWDGETVSGCEVLFVTNDRLRSGSAVPGFDALEGTELYRMGWRTNPSLVADGPGSGIYGIENDAALCLISHDQPAELDETGKIIQSETLTLAVQCRRK